ncbi:MAG: hypothetical protein MI923_20435 [Phycisphaerales bacterium]|nr:hypothetical protein [Phycisphaerales bacterium]
MGVTVIGPNSDAVTATTQLPVVPPVIKVSREWNDDFDQWYPVHDLQALSVVVAVSGQELSTATIRRWYGQGITPMEELAEGATSYPIKEPHDYRNWWVRIEFPFPEDTYETFTGRFSTERREIGGEDKTDQGGDRISTGDQEWTAYGPMRILEKIDISQAWIRSTAFDQNSQEDVTKDALIDWIPDINAGDTQALSAGNRSPEKSSGNPGVEGEEFEATYVYGGNEVWSYYEYIDYILKRFVERPGGPKWKIGGAAVEALKQLKGFFALGDSRNAAEIIRGLINPKLGIDFKIEPFSDKNESGFVIQVSALVPDELQFAGHAIPKNSETVVVEKGDSKHIEPTVWITQDHLYNKIRFLGERIVVCCTVQARTPEQIADDPRSPPTVIAGWPRKILDEGKDVTVGPGESKHVDFSEGLDAVPGVAIKRGAPSDRLKLIEVTKTGFTVKNGSSQNDASFAWEAGELEQLYLGGAVGEDNGNKEKNDEFRALDRFNHVFQRYLVPQNWDRNDGKAAPRLNARAELLPHKDGDGKNIAPIQQQFRETLDWLPLSEGVDYSQDPPVDQNATGATPDPMKPSAWIFQVNEEPVDEEPVVGPPAPDQQLPDANPGQWIQVHNPPGNEDPGISVSRLGSDLGVLLEATPNHDLALSRAEELATVPSEHAPKYDWQTLHVTLAFRADNRLAMEMELPEDVGGTRDGSVKVIRMPNAEFWYVAPETVVGVDTEGKLQRIPHKNGLVTRNDAPLMAMRMAGAISRYLSERARAEIHINAIEPWSHAVGRILDVIELPNGAVSVKSPIVSVEYDFQNSKTILRTGYQRP